jgi:hypothetical protein
MGWQFYQVNTREMTNDEYIKDIFRYCRTDSILIINAQGHLGRLWCPFRVLVIVDVYPLQKGQQKVVIAVKVAENLVDVYVIEGKAFYHYNFKILS